MTHTYTDKHVCYTSPHQLRPYILAYEYWGQPQDRSKLWVMASSAPVQTPLNLEWA